MNKYSDVIKKEDAKKTKNITGGQTDIVDPFYEVIRHDLINQYNTRPKIAPWRSFRVTLWEQVKFEMLIARQTFLLTYHRRFLYNFVHAL